MSKNQYIILMVTSVGLGHADHYQSVVQHQSQVANSVAMQQQAYINNAKQVDGTLQQLVIRIAQGSDKDSRLRDILANHGLKATLNIDGQERQFP